MLASLENSAVPKGLEKISLHPNPKEGQCQRMPQLSYKVAFSSMWIENSQKYKMDFEGAEELETRLLTYAGLWRKPESSRKTSTSASLTTQKPLTVWTTGNYSKSLKKWECLTTLSISWETYMWDRKQQLELDMEQLIGSKLGKEYDKAGYCPLLIQLICRIHHVKGWTGGIPSRN